MLSFLKNLFQLKWSQVGLVSILSVLPVLVAWKMLPKTEYLPEGDQNVIIGLMIPPQGYNINEMHRIGHDLEDRYRVYWETKAGKEKELGLKGPAVRNFLFIGVWGQLFTIVKAKDPERAKLSIGIIKFTITATKHFSRKK